MANIVKLYAKIGYNKERYEGFKTFVEEARRRIENLNVDGEKDKNFLKKMLQDKENEVSSYGQSPAPENSGSFKEWFNNKIKDKKFINNLKNYMRNPDDEKCFNELCSKDDNAVFKRIAATYTQNVSTILSNTSFNEIVKHLEKVKIIPQGSIRLSDSWFKKNQDLMKIINDQLGDSVDPYKKSLFVAQIMEKCIPQKKGEDMQETAFEKYVEKYVDLLENSKNLILTGAPGTGKTYLAKKIAMQMIGVSDERELKANERYAFVQFHPSYDYTDFVEGLRPSKEKEQKDVSFNLKNGIFKEFCKTALDNLQQNFIFIIDEINRGEISKIFGELFFSIDPSYRGIDGKVKTQYQNMIIDSDSFYDGFYVPENVYIIGTMNDIDRSVESFDFAMRRRFVWEEITAEQSAENMKLPEDTEGIMNSLNKAISKIEGLNSSYHIGAAYFLKLKKYNGDYAELWKYHLEPLLKEYLRGMPDEKTKLSNLEKAYNLQAPVDVSEEEK